MPGPGWGGWASVSGSASEPEGPVCQAQAQELEELNRELRQCNLQHFIQQTGAALPPPPRPGGAHGTQVRAARRGQVGAGPAQPRADLLLP